MTDRTISALTFAALGLSLALSALAAQPDPAPLRPAPDPALLAQIDGWIADLTTQAPKDRQSAAIAELFRHRADGADKLEPLLVSVDPVRKHAAAEILRHVEDRPPSLALLRATVDGLRHDTLPQSVGPDLWTFEFCQNACDGVEYLGEHAGAAPELLLAGLGSTDPQQQFLCAVAAGHAGIDKARALAVRVLVPHLGSNQVEGDAILAATALQRFGSAVLPDLHALRDSGDAQHRALIDLIIDELEHPEARESHAVQARKLDIGLDNALADTVLNAEAFYWHQPPRMDVGRPATSPPQEVKEPVVPSGG